MVLDSPKAPDALRRKVDFQGINTEADFGEGRGRGGLVSLCSCARVLMSCLPLASRSEATVVVLSPFEETRKRQLTAASVWTSAVGNESPSAACYNVRVLPNLCQNNRRVGSPPHNYRVHIFGAI